jgi:hypothetical protein
VNWIPLLLFALGLSVPACLKRRRLMAKYWTRVCTGRDWKRRFPVATNGEIREFLNQFVDGFLYRRKNRLKFSPDDKIMDIYRSEYPSLSFADAMELETFGKLLKQSYRIDLAKILTPDTTLGDLFALTKIKGE